jgi:hypothetical protein
MRSSFIIEETDVEKVSEKKEEYKRKNKGSSCQEAC